MTVLTPFTQNNAKSPIIEHCLTPPKLTKQGTVDQREKQRLVYKYAALTALALGLRRGELCALMWSDLRPGGIFIQRSISDSNEITGPKNEQSAAEIPVTQEMLDLMNSLPKTSPYIFSGPNGKPIQPSTLYHWMVAHTAKVCSRPYTVHELRHTMITNSIKRGTNVRVLQSISRHLQLATLLGYHHVDEEQRIDAVRAINPIGCNRVATIEQNEADSGNKEIPKTLQPQGF